MTGEIVIPAGERAVLRLFALDMPAAQARFLAEPGAAAQMLGATDLDPAQIDIINTADLTEIGLAGYLIDGFALSPEQLDLPLLNTLSGYVLLIRSRAFRGRAMTLKPAPQLTLIATLTEPVPDWSGAPLSTDSARQRPTSPRAARARARRIGATVFAVVMGLLILLVIWMAT